MAKHDRRKTSGQAPSSEPVTIPVPLPVLGVVNGGMSRKLLNLR